MTEELRRIAVEDAPTPRFGPHAEIYARYRPTYPDHVFERLKAGCGAPFDHAVDLGAGTGQATGALLSHFARVTAVEPDADMAALIPSHERLEARVQTAEEAEFPPGSIDAVLAATCFHWMDQAKVSANVGTWLRPGGAFMAVSYGLVRVVGPGKAEAAYRRVEAQWKGLKHRIVRDWRSYDAPMRQSGAFSRVEKIKETLHFEWRAERAAGFFTTTSFGAARAEERGGAEAFAAEMTRAFGGVEAQLRLEADFAGAIGIV
jgi:SAM-dependent methyltransferase